MCNYVNHSNGFCMTCLLLNPMVKTTRGRILLQGTVYKTRFESHHRKHLFFHIFHQDWECQVTYFLEPNCFRDGVQEARRSCPHPLFRSETLSEILAFWFDCKDYKEKTEIEWDRTPRSHEIFMFVSKSFQTILWHHKSLILPAVVVNDRPSFLPLVVHPNNEYEESWWHHSIV